MRVTSGGTSKSDRSRAAYRNALHRTNVTGLASRKDYKLAFPAICRQEAEHLCGLVPFHLALMEAGIACDGVGTIGLYPPNEEIPPALRQHLLEIEEVVDASGTQVMEMRESSDPRAGQFTVAARQQHGIMLVALGDAFGAHVRSLAWSTDGEGWQVSAFATTQAARYGWPRAAYQRLHVDYPELVPSRTSQEIRDLAAGRTSEGAQGGEEPWITFLEMAELIGDRSNDVRSSSVKSGQSLKSPSV